MKTNYKIKENKLFKNEAYTEISINDDYFYRNGVELNIYVEDGKIYSLSRILPFLKWPLVSSFTNLTVDSNGEIWQQGNSCLFDKI